MLLCIADCLVCSVDACLSHTVLNTSNLLHEMGQIRRQVFFFIFFTEALFFILLLVGKCTVSQLMLLLSNDFTSAPLCRYADFSHRLF